MNIFYLVTDIIGVLIPVTNPFAPSYPELKKTKIEGNNSPIFDRACLNFFEKIVSKHCSHRIVLFYPENEDFALDTLKLNFSYEISERIIGALPVPFQVVLKNDRNAMCYSFLKQDSSTINPYIIVISSRKSDRFSTPYLISVQPQQGFNETAAQQLEKYILATYDEFKKNCSPAKNYIDMVRQLPPPTLLQTRLFVHFVASHHSWYKHLRLDPPTPVFFYLNPSVEERYGEKYHKRFSSWDYCTWFCRKEEPPLLPYTLQRIGKANISALVHPHINLSIWSSKSTWTSTGFYFYSGLPDPTEEEIQDLPMDWLLKLPHGQIITRLWVFLRQQLAQLPPIEPLYQNTELPVILEEIRKKIIAPLLFGGYSIWNYPNEELINFINELDIDIQKAVIRVLEMEPYRKQWISELTSQMDEQRNSQKEPAIFQPVLFLVVQERMRQLDAMERAMTKFLAAIYT